MGAKGPESARSTPRFFAVALQSHVYTAVQYFVLDRIVLRFGTEGLAKTAFPMNIAILYGKSRSERLLRISRVSCITLGILWFSEVGCIPI